MKIITSSRIYQFFLLKTHDKLPQQISSNPAQANNQTWLTKVYKQFEETDSVYLSLLNERCYNVQNFFGWDENGCSILDYKNGKESLKIIDCKNPDIHFENNHTGIVFGKFDILKILSLPHSYWANIYKTLLLRPKDKNAPPIFSEILSVPTHKLKISNSIDSTLIPPDDEYPYFCLSFIRPPKLSKHKKLKPKEIVEIFWASLSEIWRKENFHQYNFELYLTFSLQYPLLIKGRFKSFEEIGYFNKHLRCLCDDISTIISLNPNYCIPKSSEENAESVFFTILFKLSNQTDSVAIQSIKDQLIEHINKIKKPDTDIRILNRGYYWDLVVSFETFEVKQYAETTVNEIRKIESIVKSVTIPYWSIIDQSIQKTNSPWSDHIENREIPERKKINDFWCDSLSKTPQSQHYFTKSPSYDILNIRLYNLKFDLEWLHGYLQRLYDAWKAEDLDDTVSTFDRLDELASKYLIDINKAIEYYDLFTYSPKSDFTALEQLLNEECQGIDDKEFIEIVHQFNSHKDDIEKISSNIEEAIKESWENFLKIEKDIKALKKITSSILSNFNEKLEGKQIVTATEPYLRFGERSEIFDQICDSLNTLFKDYCGNKKDNWNGLVLPSFDTEFEIYIPARVLFLPMDIKVHVHDKLLPLAHEAGHFILSDALESEAYNEFFNTVWKTLYEDAQKVILKLKKDCPDEYKVKLNRKLSSIEKQLSERKEDDTGFVDSEIFADLIAALSAGPGYFRSLGLIAFNIDSKIFPYENHPPVWLRIFLGLLLYEKEYIPCDPNWLKSTKEGFEAIKERHIDVESWIKYLKNENDKDAILAIILEIITIEEPVVGSKISALMTPLFYLIKAIIDDEKHIKNLIVWLSKYLGDDFFFFPYRDYKNKTEFKENTERIYNKCVSIAKTLLYKEELVLNEKPKMIAAASVLKPIKRPVYPSGRILHSLIYSDYQ